MILFFLGLFQLDSILPLYLDRFVVRDATRSGRVQCRHCLSYQRFRLHAFVEIALITSKSFANFISHPTAFPSPRCETVIPNVKPSDRRIFAMPDIRRVQKKHFVLSCRRTSIVTLALPEIGMNIQSPPEFRIARS